MRIRTLLPNATDNNAGEGTGAPGIFCYRRFREFARVDGSPTAWRARGRAGSNIGGRPSSAFSGRRPPAGMFSDHPFRTGRGVFPLCTNAVRDDGAPRCFNEWPCGTCVTALQDTRSFTVAALLLQSSVTVDVRRSKRYRTTVITRLLKGAACSTRR